MVTGLDGFARALGEVDAHPEACVQHIDGVQEFALSAAFRSFCPKRAGLFWKAARIVPYSAVVVEKRYQHSRPRAGWLFLWNPRNAGAENRAANLLDLVL